ncbi:MAG: polyprenyl synthetase family protein [Candidatus Hodarchaeota archaeon]
MPKQNPTSVNNQFPSSLAISASSTKPATDQSTPFLESEHVQKRIVLINEAVMNYLQTVKGEPEVLYNAAHHLIVAGGKRLRSLVTLLCCEAVGGSIDKILPITVAAELLQAASLIHDDIIDNDDLRRGVPTVHKAFGPDVAILAGDFLIAQAFRIIGTHGSPELVANIGAGGVRMCEGEVFDLFISPKNEDVFTTEEYLTMIKLKTAVFFEQAARTGAIVGEASPEKCEALAQYGSFFGFAFQLRDDVLDIQASQQKLKKTTFSDFRMKRGNYPLIYALEACSKSQRTHCLDALDNQQWDKVLKLIEKSKAIESTMHLAQSYAERAKAVLQKHGFQNKTILERLADFTVHREF